MARIGILTFHRSINYGAFMQSLALSREIAVRYPESSVEIIDYSSARMEKNYRVKFDKYCLKHPLLFFQRIKRKKKFRESLKYLPLSDRTMISDECGEVFGYIKDRYDIVIVGSDAVWNWIKRGFPNPYVMDFDLPVVRMSYAASAFGMGKEHIDAERAEVFGRSLEGYKLITVRDAYTSELVKSCCPTARPHIVCDPTAFLDLEYVLSLLGHTRESYREYMYKKYRIPADKHLICAMGSSKAIVRRIKEKYRATHRVISVFSNTGEEDYNAYGLDPLEWSLLFSLCDLTLTNFFHGTLLSLRNGTPVIAVDHTAFGTAYKGKLQDVCERVGISDCFFKLDEARSDSWNCVFDRACDILDNGEAYRLRISEGMKSLSESSEIFFNELKESI